MRDILWRADAREEMGAEAPRRIHLRCMRRWALVRRVDGRYRGEENTPAVYEEMGAIAPRRWALRRRGDGRYRGEENTPAVYEEMGAGAPRSWGYSKIKDYLLVEKLI